MLFSPLIVLMSLTLITTIFFLVKLFQKSRYLCLKNQYINQSYILKKIVKIGFFFLHPWLSTPFLIALFLGLYVFFFIFDIDHAVDEISKTNDYIEVMKMKNEALAIKFDGDNIDVFRVKLKTKNILYQQPFDLMKYYRDSFEFNTIDKPTISNLQDKFELFNIGIPTSYYINNIIEKHKNIDSEAVTFCALMEIISYLQKRVKTIFILAKGYSDTTTGSLHTLKKKDIGVFIVFSKC